MSSVMMNLTPEQIKVLAKFHKKAPKETVNISQYETLDSTTRLLKTTFTFSGFSLYVDEKGNWWQYSIQEIIPASEMASGTVDSK